MKRPAIITPDPWLGLQALTRARIALGRAGVSLPTREVLRFGVAHAQARDAVHQPLDVTRLRAELADAGFASVAVRSQAVDRGMYLCRPDRGRLLAPESLALLNTEGARLWAPRPRLAVVLAHGFQTLSWSLSALAG